jgi:hypothetical protein
MIKNRQYNQPTKLCGNNSIWQRVIKFTTYISWELLEGMKHIEAMKINYSSCQGIIVSVVLVKEFSQ